ncbi:MAG: hypothetical protein Q9N02_06145 [Ghiorsea sp.]|nr:hypothetical protein [Ghiorsea sp.]
MYDATYDKFVASAPEIAVNKARADLATLNELQSAKNKLEALV